VREETVSPAHDPNVSGSLERAMRRSARDINRAVVPSGHEARLVTCAAGWHADRTVKAQR
jgi:hypothetical protein